MEDFGDMIVKCNTKSHKQVSRIDPLDKET